MRSAVNLVGDLRLLTDSRFARHVRERLDRMKRLRSWRDVVEMLPQKHLRIVYVLDAMLAFVSLNPPALASEKHRATLLEGFQETPAVVTGRPAASTWISGRGMAASTSNSAMRASREVGHAGPHSCRPAERRGGHRDLPVHKLGSARRAFMSHRPVPPGEIRGQIK